MAKADYDFQSIYIKDRTLCDNCEKEIFPRGDPAFKDRNYGVVFCLDCWTKYEKILQEK